MLDHETNKLLTRIGPGTPMGDLLRRHWQPIAGEAELPSGAVKRIRLLGEDLALYRDIDGNLGLVDRHCPHRRADMSMGMVEDCGLRCNYHGWLFDQDGRCLEQPYEDTANPGGRYRDKVTIKAYPVRALGGLIWAYLGPDPAPQLPEWESFSWTNGFRQIVISEVPCNWLQAQENSIDPVHFEWMHANWSTRLAGRRGPYAPRHLRLDFREFEHGFTYNRVREDTDDNHPLWTVGRVCLWPNGIFTGDHFEYRVPIDDENMLSIAWFFNRVPKEAEPYRQETIPVWHGPIRDEAGHWITSHVMNQDFVAWAGQGTISDRTQEHLGMSDRGIAMLRRQLLRDLAAIERGQDPKGVIRDPAKSKQIELPTMNRKALLEGLSVAEIEKAGMLHLKRFIFQYGQPPEVMRAQEQAMGIRRDAGGLVET